MDYVTSDVQLRNHRKTVNSAHLGNKEEKLASKGRRKEGMISQPRKIWDNENIPPKARGIVKAVKNKM